MPRQTRQQSRLDAAAAAGVAHATPAAAAAHEPREPTRRQTRDAAARPALSQPNADDHDHFPGLGNAEPSALVEEVDDVDDAPLDAALDPSSGAMVEWTPDHAQMMEFVNTAGAVALRVANYTATQAEVLYFVTEFARFAQFIPSMNDIASVRDEILNITHAAMSAQIASDQAGQQAFAGEVNTLLHQQGALVMHSMQEAAAANRQRDDQDNVLLAMVNQLDQASAERSEETSRVIDFLRDSHAADAANLRQLVADRTDLVNRSVQAALDAVAAVRLDASAAFQWQTANFDAQLTTQKDAFASLLKDAEDRAVRHGNSAADAAATRAAAFAITSATATSRAEGDAARAHSDSQLTAFAASAAADRHSDAVSLRGEMQRISHDHWSRALEISATASRALCDDLDTRHQAARAQDNARIDAAQSDLEARTKIALTKVRAETVASNIALRAGFAQAQAETFTEAVEQTTSVINTTSAAHTAANDATAKQTRKLTAHVNTVAADIASVKTELAGLRAEVSDKSDKYDALARRCVANETELKSLSNTISGLRNRDNDLAADYSELASAVEALKRLCAARFDELDQAGARDYVSLARVSQAPDRTDDDGAALRKPPQAKLATTWAPPPRATTTNVPAPDGFPDFVDVDDDDEDEDLDDAPPQRHTDRGDAARCTTWSAPQPQRAKPYATARATFTAPPVHGSAAVACGDAPASSPAPRAPANVWRPPPSTQPPPHQQPPPPPQPNPYGATPPVIHVTAHPQRKADVQIPGYIDESNSEEVAKYLNRERAVELRDAVTAGVTSYPDLSMREGTLVVGSLLLAVGVYSEDLKEWRNAFERAFQDATGTPIDGQLLNRLFQGFKYLCRLVEGSLLQGATPAVLYSTAEAIDPHTRVPIGLADVFDGSNPAVIDTVVVFHDLRRAITDALYTKLIRGGTSAANAERLATLLDGAVAKTRASPASSAKMFNPVNEARAIHTARGGSSGGASSGSAPPAAPRPPNSGKRPGKQPATAPAAAGSQSKTAQQPAQSAQPASGPGGGQH